MSTGIWFPHFLPTDGGSEGLFYTVGTIDNARIWVMDLETGERRDLVSGLNPIYSPEGYSIYGAAGQSETGLRALPFSLASLEPTREAFPFPIAEGGQFASVARDGTLAYLDDTRGGANRTLIWRNRAGELLETVGQPQTLMEDPALSPDGQRIAVASREGGSPDIWVHDLIRSTKIRLTRDEGAEGSPIWSPSGREIVYWLRGAGTTSIMSRAADGTGEAVVLVESETDVFSRDWSRDGRYLFYVGQNDEIGRDIHYLDLQTDSDASEPRDVSRHAR